MNLLRSKLITKKDQLDRSRAGSVASGAAESGARSMSPCTPTEDAFTQLQTSVMKLNSWRLKTQRRIDELTKESIATRKAADRAHSSGRSTFPCSRGADLQCRSSAPELLAWTHLPRLADG